MNLKPFMGVSFHLWGSMVFSNTHLEFVVYLLHASQTHVLSTLYVVVNLHKSPTRKILFLFFNEESEIQRG